MSLSSYEKEIKDAISNLEIEDKIEEFTGEERRSILQKIQNFFVIGNRRVWWLSLRYKPESFVFEQEEPYKNITDFFAGEEEVWLVIEDDEQLLYKTNISHIINIISECSYFEYNIISQNFDRFLCENDHNEFLFVDLRNKSS